MHGSRERKSSNRHRRQVVPAWCAGGYAHWAFLKNSKRNVNGQDGIHKDAACPFFFYKSFYIKPQRRGISRLNTYIVSSFVSTSNHNGNCRILHGFWIVSSFVSTSNHNVTVTARGSTTLYLLLFLHQTTTIKKAFQIVLPLYLLLFLHQTTTTTT